MILVVGGAHSGKRTFVREKLGFAADDFVDAAQLAEGGVPAAFAGRVAYRAEELVRALDADRALERLIGFDAVILPLVGSGVVPMRAEDAQWRERAGRLGCALAARADVVVRMTCGIPQVIKGNLADAPRGTQARARLWKSSSCAMVPRRARKTMLQRGGHRRAPVERGRARFARARVRS